MKTAAEQEGRRRHAPAAASAARPDRAVALRLDDWARSARHPAAVPTERRPVGASYCDARPEPPVWAARRPAASARDEIADDGDTALAAQRAAVQGRAARTTEIAARAAGTRAVDTCCTSRSHTAQHSEPDPCRGFPEPAPWAASPSPGSERSLRRNRPSHRVLHSRCPNWFATAVGSIPTRRPVHGAPAASSGTRRPPSAGSNTPEQPPRSISSGPSTRHTPDPQVVNIRRLVAAQPRTAIAEATPFRFDRQRGA